MLGLHTCTQIYSTKIQTDQRKNGQLTRMLLASQKFLTFSVLPFKILVFQHQHLFSFYPFLISYSALFQSVQSLAPCRVSQQCSFLTLHNVSQCNFQLHTVLVVESLMSPQIQNYLQNHFCLYFKGLGGFNSLNKKVPFKGLSQTGRQIFRTLPSFGGVI